MINAVAVALLLTACSSGGSSSKAAKVAKTSSPAATQSATPTPSESSTSAPAAVASPMPLPTSAPTAAAPSAAARVVPFSAQPTSAAQAPQTSTAGRTVLALQGTGSTNSKKFTVPASWAINFSFDCTNAPDNTNFQIFPTGSDANSPVTTVNEITEQGSGTQKYSTAGTFYLVINTMCNWKLSVVS